MKFIAHRGYSKQFPENSLQAFEAVLNHPLNGHNLIGIELDIHLTKDNIIPVMHPTAVSDRQRQMVPVGEISFSQLQRMVNAGNKTNALHVPQLDEVLRLVFHKTELNLEIKQGNYDVGRFITVLVASLEKYSPCNDIVLSSFSWELLQQVMHKTTHLKINYGFIFKTLGALDELPGAVSSGLDFLHPWYQLLFSDAERISELGYPLQCWTMDDPKDINALIHCIPPGSLRAIMTNDITLAEHFEE